MIQRVIWEDHAEDAPRRPHVDGKRVDGRPEQDLRRAVPARRHVIGQRRRESPQQMLVA